jgi:hypothetical protein
MKNGGVWGLRRPWTILVLAACMTAVDIAAPAQASAETRTTTMTISASDSEPLVGERVFYSATFEPRPFEARMSFYDDGAAIAGCTNLFLWQKCWVEYGQPAEHRITATMTPSEEEESEFGFKYEVGEAPQPIEVNAVPPGTSCAAATCTARLAPTGAIQKWQVPAGVSEATFVLRGAGGGPGETSEASQDEGGNGGEVTASLTVTEGTALDLVIGEPGIPGTNSGSEVPGGYGGGGNGGADTERGGASGGGGSFVFGPAGTLLLAAGGGGGAGNLASGGNGGQTGGAGASNGLPGGTGASVTAPGLGSVGGQDGFGPTQTTAIEGRGGGGGPAVPFARSGGGGGGGYYGGGGGGTETWGAVSGGGGGSDYVSPSARAVGYDDGAGGAGGEDTADPAQPGEIEIVYAKPPEAPVEAPATAAQPSAASADPPPEAHHGERLSPHLTVYTHGGQGVINAHVLTIKASCGGVACSVQARATLRVRGLSHLPTLLSPATTIAAFSVGRASVPVPRALRRRLRHYLLHHRGAHVRIELTVRATASSGASSRETLAETLPMWTLPGLR